MSLFRKLSAHDVLASFVVFLVALPLCLGVAIASGLPPAAGIVTGIIGGIVVGLIGGAPLQVSGPAAGLTVLVWDIVQNHGISMIGPILLVAGLIQLVAGVLRAGRYFQAVPPAVIAGMLAGIGVLILVGQAHVMLGGAPVGNAVQNIAALPSALLGAISGGVPLQAGLVGGVVIAVMALWPQVAKRVKQLRLVPGALVAVVLGTVVSALAGFEIPHISLPDRLTDAMLLPTAESMGRMLDPTFLGAALALAIIASAETLLCATAVDRMHEGDRTRYDLELSAQGIGNTLCGFLGVLPMTGVIVRSSANVEAGAKSRWSAVFHGVWLLALVSLAPQLLRLIPVAALAGLLVFTGYKLAKQDLAPLRKAGRFEVAIFFSTVGAIVLTDLLKGVIFGLVLALLKIVVTFTSFRVRVTDHGAARTDVDLFGAATFLKLPELNASLAAIPAGREVHLHLDGLDYLDHAALETISAWEKQHVKRGGIISLDWEALQHRTRRPSAEARALESTRPALERREVVS